MNLIVQPLPARTCSPRSPPGRGSHQSNRLPNLTRLAQESLFSNLPTLWARNQHSTMLMIAQEWEWLSAQKTQWACNGRQRLVPIDITAAIPTSARIAEVENMGVQTGMVRSNTRLTNMPWLWLLSLQVDSVSPPKFRMRSMIHDGPSWSMPISIPLILRMHKYREKKGYEESRRVTEGLLLSVARDGRGPSNRTTRSSDLGSFLTCGMQLWEKY